MTKAAQSAEQGVSLYINCDIYKLINVSIDFYRCWQAFNGLATRHYSCHLLSCKYGELKLLLVLGITTNWLRL